MTAGRARRGRAVPFLASVAVVGLVAACSSGGDPSPAPSPTPQPVAAEPDPEPARGLRVGVVLPARETTTASVLDTMLADLDRLEDDPPDGVTELRVVVPDGAAFVGDAVTVLADSGYGLVCVVGPTAAAAVGALAVDYPEVRFCVLPARLRGNTPNVLGIDVRIEEFAFLAGAAAARPSGGGPVQLVGPARFATDRQRVAFLAGVERIRGVVPERTTTVVVADEQLAHAAATEAYEAGTFVVVTDAGAADRAVLQAAQEQGSLVIGSAATLREPMGDPAASPAPISPSVLLLLRERLDVPIRLAIEQALGDWQGGAASVGLAEGALELMGGGSAIWPVIEPQILSLRNALVAGDLVVPTGP